MNCKYCDSKLTGDSKFCNKCGKPILTEKSKVDIEKIKKKLINTGNSVSAIGWLTIFINIGLFFWSIFDKNFIEYGIPAGDFSGTFLMVTAASIFIILGNRIRGLKDKNIKLYLQILLILSLLIMVWVFTTGGRVGILFFLVIVYLISSLISIHKAMKVEEFTVTLSNPKYKLNGKGWIFFAVATIVLFFITIGVDLSISNNNYLTQSISEQSNNYSKTDLIIATVKETKASMILPNQLDEVTQLVDITAEAGAIRYHYILSGIDTSKLSKEYLKNYLGSSICQNNDSKNLLNNGINMEYSYIVNGSNESYFVSFTNADCI